MIKLKGGAEVTMLSGSTRCKACGVEMYWAVTANGKRIPIVKDGEEWMSHFANCPEANRFRRK
jgi:hypothetical protein